jgi:hypothetical protein
MKKNNLLIISVMVMMVLSVSLPSKACDSVSTPHDYFDNVDVYRSNRWTERNEWITVHVYKGKAAKARCKMQEGDITFVNYARVRLDWISVAAECKMGVLSSHGGSRFRNNELFYAEDIPGYGNFGQDFFVRWDRLVRPRNIFDLSHTYKKYRWNCDACTFPETEFSAPDEVGNCCLTIRYKYGGIHTSVFTDSVYVEPCSSVQIYPGSSFAH